MSVLDRIVEATRDEVERRREVVSLAQLESALTGRPGPRPFQEALTRPGISLIAEHKRRSPSAGLIREGADVVEVVQAYERGGAAALSVLTEEAHFGGSLDDLRAARTATALPVLRKDFIVDRYQLYESAAAGADAILLIVAALEEDVLGELHREARALDLDVLVEVHDEEELQAALEVEAEVIGINNRDLGDFSVDIQRTYELLVRRAGGQDGRLGVGLLDPRPARRARPRRGRRGADRRDADARAGPRGGLPRAGRRPRRLSPLYHRLARLHRGDAPWTADAQLDGHRDRSRLGGGVAAAWRRSSAREWSATATRSTASTTERAG